MVKKRRKIRKQISITQLKTIITIIKISSKSRRGEQIRSITITRIYLKLESMVNKSKKTKGKVRRREHTCRAHCADRWRSMEHARRVSASLKYNWFAWRPQAWHVLIQIKQPGRDPVIEWLEAPASHRGYIFSPAVIS